MLKLDDYEIGARYEIYLPRHAMFLPDQLPEGFVGTLRRVYMSSGKIWGNFEECAKYNYILELCVKVKQQSRTNKMLKAIQC